MIDAAAPQTPPDDGISGTLIGERYLVIRLLGEGGMGRVYEAEHTKLRKRVALKVLHPEQCSDPEALERFLREAQAASAIHHPNIVDVSDFGTTPGGQTFLVMELLDGMSLRDLLQSEGPLPPDRAATVGAQICRGLQAAHDAGIIHRDLKPENIFLIHREGTLSFVKVLDFGVAKSGLAPRPQRRSSARVQLLTGEPGEAGSAAAGPASSPAEGSGSGAVQSWRPRLTSPGNALGTAEYMAPEQATADAIDHRADIYAVGLILFEMLTGKLPFSGRDLQEITDQKLTCKAPSPRVFRRGLVIDRDLETVLLQCLAVAPYERPTSMARLEYELNKVSGGRGPAVARLLGIDAAGAGAAAPLVPAASSLPAEKPASRQPLSPGSERRLTIMLLIATVALVANIVLTERRPSAPSGVMDLLPRAREAYREQRFDEASRLFTELASRLAGADRDRARQLAAGSRELVTVLEEARSPSPERACAALRQALAIDARSGSVHQAELGRRLGQQPGCGL